MEIPFINYSKALLQVTKNWHLNQFALKSLVHKKLESLLIFSYHHVPYYQSTMKKIGYNPEKHYSGVSDLQYLPIVSKEDRKSNPAQFLAPGINLNKCACYKTSGSTGIPLKIYRTPYDSAVQVAKWMRVLFINGYRPTFKTMSLSAPHRKLNKPSLIQRMGLFRRKIVSFLSMPEEITDEIIKFNPQVLYGNRQQIDFIALELFRRNIKLSNLKLLLETGAIIRENNRVFHKKQFGTHIIETYGSEEIGTIAHDIREANGLRICEDTTFVEFLDDNNRPVGPGESGKVIVTDLGNQINPFIRYDIGDFATYDYVRQKDGTKKKVIKKILGRECDYVVLPDGSHRLYYDFYDIVSQFEQIHQCRIVQKSNTLIHLEVVSDGEYLKKISSDLLKKSKKAFPDEMIFKIIKKEKIGLDPTGKIRMFICEVDSLPDLTPDMHRPLKEGALENGLL